MRLSRTRAKLCSLAAFLLVPASLAAQQPEKQMEPTPRRAPGEGDGPFERLIIRGATLIDGTGAPPRGPVDIVIKGSRIDSVVSVGYPKLPIKESGRPKGPAREIDATGMYVLPGFIDMHVHTGGVPKAPQAEYVYKLWLAHGVTTVRGVPFGDFDWSLGEKALSARNEIVAPRMVSYHRPGTGKGWKGGPINSPEAARAWVRWAARQRVDGQGIDGLKLGAHDPEVMKALLDEAKRHNLGTVAHLDQMGVVRMTALDAARLGLGSMTHFYGLFESMLKDYSIQNYPMDQNYNDEQHRFGQVARLWNQTHEPGSPEWRALLDEFRRLDFTLNPTMVIYSAGRDVMRAREAEWHDTYTLPSQWAFYQPSREAHGSYWFDWTTHDEVAWRNFYHRWMRFLNDYKNRGGRVTVGTDCGFIYQLYGFCYVTELEMLQEAGFHPLEVIRSATLHGAEEIFKPKEAPIQYGIVRPGLAADLVIIPENPLHNLKTLYGTGAVRINDETAKVERVGGVKYTIKEGIVYDARKLLADVARMVEEAKQRQGATAASP
jgi:imidazolonepropionase-like amidohydrolase